MTIKFNYQFIKCYDTAVYCRIRIFILVGFSIFIILKQ